ncbi:MAG: OmpH family outer membrane protein [Cyanobacteria bacterium RUI128]|nr:OmpH family outer membrane protein [Cyanobacteria bacterium RUI128]
MKSLRLFFVMCCILMFAQIGFASDKIGVVDIQVLVSKSHAVNELKQEHNAQLQSLDSIITEAQNAIALENDPQKIIELQDKYNAEFNKQKELIDNRYKAGLSTLEENLKHDITESAKRHNYDIVIAKNVVFLGGDDITDIVAKDIR